MEILIPLILVCVVCGIVGMAIGDLGDKKNGALGGLLGGMLGPIGWIIVAVLPPAEEKPAAGTKKETDAEKLARLEAELAKLSSPKTGAMKATRPRAKEDLAGDGEVPTYKLD